MIEVEVPEGDLREVTAGQLRAGSIFRANDRWYLATSSSHYGGIFCLSENGSLNDYVFSGAEQVELAPPGTVFKITQE